VKYGSPQLANDTNGPRSKTVTSADSSNRRTLAAQDAPPATPPTITTLFRVSIDPYSYHDPAEPDSISQLQPYFASSLRIDFNSPRRFSVDFGYAILSSLSVSRTIWETIKRALSLSSAGTTYQGAREVLVALRQAS
jgi:hypothetical protein